MNIPSQNESYKQQRDPELAAALAAELALPPSRNPRPYKPNSPDQYEIALQAVPDQVRGHGLQAAHVAPRVGRKTDAGFWSGRVPASHAWLYPYIVMQDAGAVWVLLALDCDDRAAMGAGLSDLPPTNMMVRTPRGAHLYWCLAVPVAKHMNARQGPETYLQRVAEFFAFAVQADPAFSGLGRNPAHPDADVIWGREQPYTLDQMATIIPFGWKKPKVSNTAIGRNRDMFTAGMKFAGQWRNRDLPVLTALHSVRDEVCGNYPNADHPYGLNEMEATAKWIERQRQGWLRNGWHKPAWIERQAARGRISGKARRGRVAARDQLIIEAVATGVSMRQVAKDFGFSSEGSVRHIVNRDAPLLVFGDEAPKPWEAEGISRRTWYRRREAGGTGAQ